MADALGLAGPGCIGGGRARRLALFALEISARRILNVRNFPSDALPDHPTVAHRKAPRP